MSLNIVGKFIDKRFLNKDGSINKLRSFIGIIIIIILTTVSYLYTSDCPSCGLFRYKCKCDNNTCGCKIKNGLCKCK